MHYKRKRAKTALAGCLMDKTWKVNGFASEAETRGLRVMRVRPDHPRDRRISTLTKA